MPVKRNISETSSSTKESNKTPKILKAVRKNIETLSDKELKRYLAALSRMQLNAITDPYNDWWNLNAIHGGNFRQAVEAGLRPAYAQYLKDYTPVDLVNNFDEQDWQIGGFCAHSIPTFLVWHRVYVQAFELLLQHYDPEPNSAEGPLAAHYWHWDAPAYKLPDANCAWKVENYVWVVHISEAVLGLVEANLKSLHPLGKGLLLLSSSTGKNQAAIAADFVRFEKQDDNGQTVAVEDVPYDSIELLSQLKHTTNGVEIERINGGTIMKELLTN